MNAATRRKFGVAVLLGCTFVASVAYGATGVQTHWTTGTDGVHQSTYHGNNPAHAWIGVGADHAGTITSGGQYHDHCLNSGPCVAGFNGDFALDIGGGPSGGQDMTLNLGWLGTAGDAYATETPDLSKTINISAVLAGQGNFRGTQAFGDPNHPACNWQAWNVLLSYTATTGAPRTDLLIGKVWFAHVDPNAAPYKAVGTSRIDPNLSSPAAGGGRIRYISGVKIGVVTSASDGGDCSSGPHSHMEFLSTHAYGKFYEWHSGDANNYGPEAYYQNGQNAVDWYKGWSDPKYPNTRYYPVPGAYDSVYQGQTLGFLGGGSTSFYMVDNPNTTNH